MVHRAVDRDILSGPWVTLLELVPGSSIMSCLLPCKAWPVDMFMCMRILYIGAPSQRHRSDVAAPSQRHRSDVAAPSQRRRSYVAATSQRHRPDIGPTSERRRSAIAAISARHRPDVAATCRECPSRPPYVREFPRVRATRIASARIIYT